MKKVRWGVLSTAKIAREKVIPALQGSEFCSVVAIASPNKEEAQRIAGRFNIPVVYDSYEQLLEDPEIEAVYIPLPNHLHIPWAVKAVERNKHVLCEKPIALSSAEGKTLQVAAQQKPHLKVMEAFMYRFHPQWQQAVKLLGEGRIGALKTVQSFFSYYNVDPGNIRNQRAAGGGGMMDIGCYCVSLSRFLFGEEPLKVLGIVEDDPQFHTDRLASGILRFSAGTATFTCSTQSAPYQHVNIIGTEARIEIEIPFNAPADKATRLLLYTKSGTEEFLFDAVDQYTLQGDLFSKAILHDTEVPTPLQDAINNMSVIEAVFQSSAEGAWKDIV